jgi:tetratricopeptide (TPR) repeat protein
MILAWFIRLILYRARVLRPISRILCAIALIAAISVSAVDPETPAAPAIPAVTNAPATNAQSAEMDALLRSVLLLQEQLRNTQREIQQARDEANVASRRTTDLLNDRLNFIEQKQFDAMQRSNQLMLTVVGVIAALACIAVILSGWVQMRAVSRLADISKQLESLPALIAPPSFHQLSNGEHAQPTATVQASADLLTSNVDRLQKRLDELEQTATSGARGNGRHLPAGATAVASTLIAKGQSFLNVDKPADALVCFDEAVAIEPKNIEAWLKKGSALEKLGRVDEAIAAYDRAIEADDSVATAYLFKAGVYNRQKRYSEALQCYEKALHVQKSRSPAAA